MVSSVAKSILAVSFGVIFATFITLILVPTEYLILDDLRRGLGKLLRRDTAEGKDAAGGGPPFANAPAIEGLQREGGTELIR